MTGLLLVLALCTTAGAQDLLDRVVLRFGAEIITQLDVRQARLLRLVDVANDTDQAYVDALVSRRLILAELRRTPPPEPAAEALLARRRTWEGRLGADGNVAALLTQAGMTETGLRGWLRDDLRMQTYLDERFSTRSADFTNWIAALRQRAGLR